MEAAFPEVILSGKFLKPMSILFLKYYLTNTKNGVHLSHQQRKEVMLDELILNSGGKFVTVTFTKKDGSERVLNGRLGVTKHLKGGINTVDLDKFVVIYDMQAEGYRSINRQTIKSVKIDGLIHSYGG